MTQGSTKGVPIDTDATLSANSNQLVASQAATKTYVDNKVATISSPVIKSAVVDFGSTGVGATSFTITDAAITTLKNIQCTVVYSAPAGKQLDELEFDQFDMKAVAGTGNFTLYVTPANNGLVYGQFNINYSIG